MLILTCRRCDEDANLPPSKSIIYVYVDIYIYMYVKKRWENHLRLSEYFSHNPGYLHKSLLNKLFMQEFLADGVCAARNCLKRVDGTAQNAN